MFAKTTNGQNASKNKKQLSHGARHTGHGDCLSASSESTNTAKPAILWLSKEMSILHQMSGPKGRPSLPDSHGPTASRLLQTLWWAFAHQEAESQLHRWALHSEGLRQESCPFPHHLRWNHVKQEQPEASSSPFEASSFHMMPQMNAWTSDHDPWWSQEESKWIRQQMSLTWCGMSWH